jgi:hypothetical protein
LTLDSSTRAKKPIQCHVPKTTAFQSGYSPCAHPHCRCNTAHPARAQPRPTSGVVGLYSHVPGCADHDFIEQQVMQPSGTPCGSAEHAEQQVMQPSGAPYPLRLRRACPSVPRRRRTRPPTEICKVINRHQHEKTNSGILRLMMILRYVYSLNKRFEPNDFSYTASEEIFSRALNCRTATR